jgi:hypothetical protein
VQRTTVSAIDRRQIEPTDVQDQKNRYQDQDCPFAQVFHGRLPHAAKPRRPKKWWGFGRADVTGLTLSPIFGAI